ncbi:unnamed protein product [Brachionus calyciflorus]|uniref:Sacsin/Nov domain-containing protein n=1 Tax=Brachionus calyciflorus TaxID=104777 RepID=A0A814N8T4_9BILA|nr:unnamed protein product [Brachionus calyciflorus]
MSDFSLEIPHLTYYLKRILNRYPLGGQILKELLQNAEDSSASVVKFFIDYSEYPCEKLLHLGLAKFQQYSTDLKFIYKTRAKAT